MAFGAPDEHRLVDEMAQEKDLMRRGAYAAQKYMRFILLTAGVIGSSITATIASGGVNSSWTKTLVPTPLPSVRGTPN